MEQIDADARYEQGTSTRAETPAVSSRYQFIYMISSWLVRPFPGNAGMAYGHSA